MLVEVPFNFGHNTRLYRIEGFILFAFTMSNRVCHFKLVLLGDAAVGKSCLVVRFVRDEFFEFQEPTIGGKLFNHRVHDDDHENCSMSARRSVRRVLPANVPGQDTMKKRMNTHRHFFLDHVQDEAPGADNPLLLLDFF